jgi:hypothetical protein
MQRLVDFSKALIHHEAKIGGRLFGPTPKDTRREFFCLDEHTWVWHEEWNDEKGKHHIMTTRYDIRPDGVLKSQGGYSYRRIKGVEELNFRKAVKSYCEQVIGEYDRMLTAA